MRTFDGARSPLFSDLFWPGRGVRSRRLSRRLASHADGWWHDLFGPSKPNRGRPDEGSQGAASPEAAPRAERESSCPAGAALLRAPASVTRRSSPTPRTTRPGRRADRLGEMAFEGRTSGRRGRWAWPATSRRTTRLGRRRRNSCEAGARAAPYAPVAAAEASAWTRHLGARRGLGDAR